MFKWDRLSWVAAGIFVVGIVLGGAVHNTFFFLLVGAYLLRPALLAFGVGAGYADERQTQIQFHSGNIALIAVVAAIIVYAVRETLAGRPADAFQILLVVALVTKAVVGLVMHGDHMRTALRIVSFIVLLYLSFVLLEGGLTLGTLIEGAPGLAIAAVGLLSRKFPLIGAILFAVLACAALYVFGLLGGLTSTRLFVSLILPLPLFVVSGCLALAWKARRAAPPATTA